MTYYNLIKLAEDNDKGLHPALSGATILGGGAVVSTANRDRDFQNMIIKAHRSVLQNIGEDADGAVRKDMIKRQLKRAGAVGAMVTGIGLAGYGAKKLYDRYTK